MWQTEADWKPWKEYKVRNQKKYGKRFKSINDQIDSLIRMSRSKAVSRQERRILQAIKKGFKGLRKLAQGYGRVFKLNDRKLETLIKATRDDMEKAETAVLHKANDDYRKRSSMPLGICQYRCWNIWKGCGHGYKDMLSRGLNCVEYANGARHTLSDYADMAIRTAGKGLICKVEGESGRNGGIYYSHYGKAVVIRVLSAFLLLVKVLIDDVGGAGGVEGRRGPGDWQEVFSYELHNQQGLYHPRCKGTVILHISLVSLQRMIPGLKKSWKQLGFKTSRGGQTAVCTQRQEEKYKRLAEYSLDEENQKNTR